MSDTPTSPAPEKTKTLAGLKKRAVHEDVTLPSGAVVDIKLPNLPSMVESGAIPNDLIESALAQQSAEKLTVDILKHTWDWTVFIIPRMLVTPKINTDRDAAKIADDVREIDAADTQLLLDFAARRTDMDAVGHQLGGLETQRSFREHRGILSLDEALGGVSGD